MVNLQVTTTNGTASVLGEKAVEEFRKSLRGQLICPGDGGYDDARMVWNAMIDRRPGMIARCAGVSDVINCVNFARDNNLLVSVRGGGHNVAGNAVCDGGLMIDLSLMKGIRVDPAQRTAQAQAGLTWGEYDRETQVFGLASTGGVIPTTGIAGLTLGGGIGWLMGKHGLACDNLLSADMVTADGRAVTASPSENADLFWGLRGGGGNFGVVTSFRYQLHPVSQMLGGLVLHPLDKAREFLRFYRDFSSDIPDELSTMAALITSPDGQPMVGVLVGYIGAINEGERILRPLREFGPPALDGVGPIPYLTLQGMLLEGFPSGQQNYWKSNFITSLSDEAIDTMVERYSTVPSPGSALVLEQMAGAVTRLGADETAFNHRNVPFNFLIIGIWPDAAANQKNIQWVRNTWDAMQPFSSGGVYVNYLGQEADEGSQRIREAYGPAKYERLVALKNKYDPKNLFRLNQNIRPTV
jgi:FAD/FMN-containing dehydrogenase